MSQCHDAYGGWESEQPGNALSSPEPPTRSTVSISFVDDGPFTVATATFADEGSTTTRDGRARRSADPAADRALARAMALMALGQELEAQVAP